MRNSSLHLSSISGFQSLLEYCSLSLKKKKIKGEEVGGEKGKDMNEKVKQELVLCLDDENKN